MSLHIHNPAKTYFVRYRYSGHRHYEVDGKRFKGSAPAIRRMARLFNEHAGRGSKPRFYEVAFASKFYEPAVLVEMVRK